MPTEILRKNGEDVKLTNGQYTVTRNDRDGFSIRCSDPTNSGWKSVSEADVEKTSNEFLPGCKFMIIHRTSFTSKPKIVYVNAGIFLSLWLT